MTKISIVLLQLYIKALHEKGLITDDDRKELDMWLIVEEKKFKN